MMMMSARSISQTLIRGVSSSSYPLISLFAPKSSSSSSSSASATTTTTLLKCRHHLPYYRLIARRHQSSSHDTPSQVVVLDDVDLNHADDESLAVQKIEDDIHRNIVRRSAPDWLPFLTGSSYWVPPPPPSYGGIAQIVHKLANPLTYEEAMSLTTLLGWPSSAFYLHHGSLRQ